MMRDVYTSLEEAKKEIRRRWQDVNLRKEIATFVGGVPKWLKKNPRAILNRDIATPNFEFKEFVKKAIQIGLNPIVAEYSEDKFVGINPDKKALAKMAIFEGIDRNDNAIFHCRNIIDFAKYDGKKFAEIRTLWGETISEFHHKLLSLLYPDVEVIDNSIWLKSRGNNAREFYVYELSLCICHGVLFENFILNDQEKIFCEDVVWPALERIFSLSLFGYKPIIVTLTSSTDKDRDVNDIYWNCYPRFFDDEILRRIPID